MPKQTLSVTLYNTLAHASTVKMVRIHDRIAASLVLLVGHRLVRFPFISEPEKTVRKKCSSNNEVIDAVNGYFWKKPRDIVLPKCTFEKRRPRCIETKGNRIENYINFSSITCLSFRVSCTYQSLLPSVRIT